MENIYILYTTEIDEYPVLVGVYTRDKFEEVAKEIIDDLKETRMSTLNILREQLKAVSDLVDISKNTSIKDSTYAYSNTSKKLDLEQSVEANEQFLNRLNNMSSIEGLKYTQYTYKEVPLNQKCDIELG